MNRRRGMGGLRQGHETDGGPGGIGHQDSEPSWLEADRRFHPTDSRAGYEETQMLRRTLADTWPRRFAELPLVVLIVLVQPVLVFTLLGCDGQLGGPPGSGQDTEDDNSATDANQVSLDRGDDGDQVTLVVGDRLTLALSANHTTGYTWGLVELDESVLEQTDQDYTVEGCPPDWDGCGGYETWTFTAVSAGTTTLRLEEREWHVPEGGDLAGTFEVTVTATEEAD